MLASKSWPSASTTVRKFLLFKAHSLPSLLWQSKQSNTKIKGDLRTDDEMGEGEVDQKEVQSHPLNFSFPSDMEDKFYCAHCT